MLSDGRKQDGIKSGRVGLSGTEWNRAGLENKTILNRAGQGGIMRDGLHVPSHPAASFPILSHPIPTYPPPILAHPSLSLGVTVTITRFR